MMTTCLTAMLAEILVGTSNTMALATQHALGVSVEQVENCSGSAQAKLSAPFWQNC
jgi:hypothetical protein